MQVFQQISAGILQGSPASPILFLIYIHQLFGSLNNFTLSYIDDVFISAFSTSLKKNVHLLKRDIATLFSLGVPTAIKFNLPKTELLYYTTGKRTLTESLTLPDQTVIMPGSTVCWLGIYFDRGFFFKDHVFIRASQARFAFFGMCRLANSERGLSPYALRQLYLACVTSIANYGYQIYWKRRSSFNSKLQTLQNMALRKILGTLRTAPTLSSKVETALPPPAIRLDSTLRQYAFRIYKLPSNHLLKEASRAIEAQLYPDPNSNLDSDATETSEQRLTSKMLEGPPSVRG
jgi:hypothetical protein